jgi:hypothetical protein
MKMFRNQQNRAIVLENQLPIMRKYGQTPTVDQTMPPRH